MKEKKSAGREIIDWMLHIGTAVLAGLLIVNFIMQFVIVHKTSMRPTLDDGDILVIEKIMPRFGTIDRGDIITINDVQIMPGLTETLIKRVIAVGNDKIEISDGKVYVNGEVLDEPYINGDRTFSVKGEYSSMTVPEGYIYVMGDNRLPGESYDSRSIGPVSVKNIGGRVILRLLPLMKFGLVLKTAQQVY